MAVFASHQGTANRGLIRLAEELSWRLKRRAGPSMKANWYYIENDETVGPTTLEDLARRIGQTGETLLVWTQGMTEWTDAEAIPTLSQLVRSRSPLTAAAPETSIAAETVIHGKATLGKRLGNELSEYFVIS